MLVDEEVIDEWSFDADLGLQFHGSTFVLVVSRDLVMTEFHHLRLVVHPRGTKMYHDLHRQYWWSGMKCNVASFVSRCLTCQQVKVEHRRPTGLLQPLPVAEWKWEHMTMDLVFGLPRSPRGHDAI